MKSYLFSLFLLFLLLILTFYASADLKEIRFLSREYILDSKYIPQLIDFSRREDIPLKVLQNWILTESSGDEKAFNRKSKDYGLCQLHDVSFLKEKYWKRSEPFDIWNGEHNLFIALSYLSDLIKTFNKKDAFLAYNIGRGRVSRGMVLKCGIDYVGKVWGDFKTPLEESKLTSTSFKYPLSFQEQVLFDDRRQRI